VGDYGLFIGIDQTHAQQRGHDDALLGLTVHKRFVVVVFGSPKVSRLAVECLL